MESTQMTRRERFLWLLGFLWGLDGMSDPRVRESQAEDLLHRLETVATKAEWIQAVNYSSERLWLKPWVLQAAEQLWEEVRCQQ